MTRAAGQARLCGILGASWGCALLGFGPELWFALTDRPPTEADRFGMQALGVRHLGQGLFQLLAPTAGQRVFAAVDLLHATSMLALAVRDRSRRRPALVSVALTDAVLLLSWRFPARPTS